DRGLMPAGALMAGITPHLVGGPSTGAVMGGLVVVLALLVAWRVPRMRQIAILFFYTDLLLYFAQQRHFVRDGDRHAGFLRLLLDKPPLDAEIVVGKQPVRAEARFRDVVGARRCLLVDLVHRHDEPHGFAAVVAHEHEAAERGAQRALDHFRLRADLSFLRAETGDRMYPNRGGIAEQAVAWLLHQDIRRRRHQASLRDVFLQRGPARAGRAEREQLILAFLQSQMLQMLLG